MKAGRAKPRVGLPARGKRAPKYEGDIRARAMQGDPGAIAAIIRDLDNHERGEPKKRDERLVCFLYLLMRDTTPTGEVARLFHEAMQDLPQPTVKTEADRHVYTNKHLEAYARELAAKLTA